jgi:hypothetical protein
MIFRGLFAIQTRFIRDLFLGYSKFLRFIRVLFAVYLRFICGFILIRGLFAYKTRKTRINREQTVYKSRNPRINRKILE